MSRFARQSFRAHDDRDGVEAFGWLAGCNAVVSSNEAERHESSYFVSSRSFVLLSG
jgi:hypothetical protein